MCSVVVYLVKCYVMHNLAGYITFATHVGAECGNAMF